MPDQQLVFIVSQPRSGSTLLQTLLANHNDIATDEEPWFLLPFLSYTNLDVTSSKYNSELCLKAIKQFIARSIGSTGFEQNLRNFIKDTYKTVTDKPIYLDKTPRYYEILNEIVRILPHSKIILLVRHPLDVLTSIIKTWSVENYKYLAMLYGRDLIIAPDKINDFYLKYKGNKNVRLVYYEDLIQKPEYVIEELYKWLGVEYSIINTELKHKKEDYDIILGDPNIKTTKRPLSTNTNKWKPELKNKYWRDIILGYGNYIQQKRFELFSHYHYDFKSTYKFEYFLEVYGNPEISNISIKKIIKMLFYRKVLNMKQ